VAFNGKNWHWFHNKITAQYETNAMLNSIKDTSIYKKKHSGVG